MAVMIHLVVRHSLVVPVHANSETYLHSDMRCGPRLREIRNLCARDIPLFEDCGLFAA